MPRRATIDKREVLPDPVYNSRLVTKFINNVTKSGKKTVAEQIFYGALGLIEERTGDEPVSVLNSALENSKPRLEVRSRRVGGATYQVPVEVNPRRANTLALRWLVGYARARREKTMGRRLAGELLDAKDNTGSTVKRKDDTHRMAEANRAFAHYRW